MKSAALGFREARKFHRQPKGKGARRDIEALIEHAATP